jgi:hypothetical protein
MNVLIVNSMLSFRCNQCFIQSCNPGGPGGVLELGRTPNDVDARFLTTLLPCFLFVFFYKFSPICSQTSNHSSLQSLLPSLVPARSPKPNHNLILLLSDRRAISSIGSRATPKKKFFSQISPGGLTLRSGGPSPPPPRGNA